MITDNLDLAAQFIREGKILAFPTETVWGIGADAFNHTACKKIYSIKGRPEDNPLIIHVPAVSSIPSIAFVDPKMLSSLANWMPGPLTIIVKKKANSLFTCGLCTVAVRVPTGGRSGEMIRRAGVPVAAPSANVSGKPSITRFKDVVETFQGKVDCILRGEDPLHGIESTVIDLSSKIPVYLRPGVISFEAIQGVLPNLRRHTLDSSIPLSPGIKYRHYSPEAEVFIVSDMRNDWDGREKRQKIGQIGFQFHSRSDLDHQVVNNIEYAKDLYAFFIECDKQGIRKVYCQVPKDGELYQAILHRLKKAAYR